MMGFAFILFKGTGTKEGLNRQEFKKPFPNTCTCTSDVVPPQFCSVPLV